MPRIVVRRGVLPGNSPFHFEGEWAERIGDRYILYNGWVTNCKLPNPWWRMQGPKFDIVPGERAVSHKSVFLLRNIPLFYTPFFYHSLEKEPRKSGFLMPNLVPRSKRGFMVGLGYYWAINRDYDVTYRFQDFTTHAFTHHVDFRGKPRAGHRLRFHPVRRSGSRAAQPDNTPPRPTAASTFTPSAGPTRQRLDRARQSSTTSARSASASNGRSPIRKRSARKSTRSARSGRTGRAISLQRGRRAAAELRIDAKFR